MMEAASRDTYVAARDQLDAYAAQAQPDDIRATAEDLLAVAGLLRREPRLRRALADPARPGDERAGLLRALVEGKVRADALTVLSTLVGGRSASAIELLDSAERLGVDALLAAADRAGELGEVEDELFRFGQVVDGSPELAAALGDPSVEPARRSTLVASLLDGKATATTLRLAELALVGFGGRGFAASLTRLVELAAERRDRQVAYVTVAAPLSDAEERRLGDRLSEIYGRQVSLKVSVDPRILGGVRVRVNHDLYDGTILRRLNETRNALAAK
ncbi:MAG TPA: F0F1 ATP synthase subunit delta [Micromonosporaceae bacterium]